MRFELRQNNLDKARIFSGLGGKLLGLSGRAGRRDIDKTVLGLRHDLLRDDEHIAVLERHIGVDQG